MSQNRLSPEDIRILEKARKALFLPPWKSDWRPDFVWLPRRSSITGKFIMGPVYSRLVANQRTPIISRHIVEYATQMEIAEYRLTYDD